MCVYFSTFDTSNVNFHFQKYHISGIKIFNHEHNQQSIATMYTVSPQGRIEEYRIEVGDCFHGT